MNIPLKSMSGLLGRPIAPLLLVLAVFQLTSATGSSPFSSCLPKSVHHAPAGQAAHSNLTKRSFVNDRYTPQFIVLARSSSDVAYAIRCTRHVGLRVCHSFVDKSLCPGVMMDVGAIRYVLMSYDNVAAIGPGAIMGEVFWKLHQYGRWIPGTASPAKGASAGYILGGGRGLYERSIGLACQLLVEVTLVTRKGLIVKTSRWRHSDLFRVMCGAGDGQ